MVKGSSLLVLHWNTTLQAPANFSRIFGWNAEIVDGTSIPNVLDTLHNILYNRVDEVEWHSDISHRTVRAKANPASYRRSVKLLAFSPVSVLGLVTTITKESD